MRTTIFIYRVVIIVGKRKDLTNEHIKQIREKLSKFKKETRLEIVELYKIKSATAIGKIYNVGAQTIQNALKLEGITIRGRSKAQQHYLKTDNSRSERQSKFMKENNPMNELKNRKKCSQPGKLNGMWNGGKIEIICDMCKKVRLIKKSNFKRYLLNGRCWNCYKHSCPKSSLEIKTAEELTKQGIKFKEQVPYHGMFLDFLLPNKVVIEVDGNYWHNLPENKNRDKRKNRLLKQEGYKLFRFNETRINNNIHDCIAEVITNGQKTNTSNKS